MAGAEPWQAFPSFEPLFRTSEVEPEPAYAELLNLGGDRAPEALWAVLRGPANLEHEVVALLAEPNWRVNLVGAAAVGLGAITPLTVAAVWACADRGSWVSPQLAAVASMADPCFLGSARARIEQGCPYVGGDEPRRWRVAPRSGASPDVGPARSAKLFGALIALVERGGVHDWLAQALKSQGLLALQGEESTQAASFALRWRAGLEALRAHAP